MLMGMSLQEEGAPLRTTTLEGVTMRTTATESTLMSLTPWKSTKGSRKARGMSLDQCFFFVLSFGDGSERVREA